MERVAIFVDGPNIGRRRDLARIIQWLVNGRDLVKVFYYGTENPELYTDYPEIMGLLPLEIRLYQEAKRTDVALAVDMVFSAVQNEFDTAILVSGDVDYIPAIEKLKGLSKRIEVAAFGNPAEELKNAADDIHLLRLRLKEIQRKR